MANLDGLSRCIRTCFLKYTWVLCSLLILKYLYTDKATLSLREAGFRSLGTNIGRNCKKSRADCENNTADCENGCWSLKEMDGREPRHGLNRDLLS